MSSNNSKMIQRPTLLFAAYGFRMREIYSRPIHIFYAWLTLINEIRCEHEWKIGQPPQIQVFAADRNATQVPDPSERDNHQTNDKYNHRFSIILKYQMQTGLQCVHYVWMNVSDDGHSRSALFTLFRKQSILSLRFRSQSLVRAGKYLVVWLASNHTSDTFDVKTKAFFFRVTIGKLRATYFSCLCSNIPEPQLGAIGSVSHEAKWTIDAIYLKPSPAPLKLRTNHTIFLSPNAKLQ